MRKSKFSETQIVGILKDAESGVPVADLLRKHGVSKATFFKWRSKYGGASVSDVKRLRELEVENAKLKRMYADLALENAAIKDVLEPKVVTPSAKRQVAEVLVREHQLPVQRACRVVRLSRTAYYQPPLPASRRDAAVIAALTDVVARYPRWGFWKLFDRLRVEGRPWNHKHVHRVYCALRLNLPRRTTRRVPRRIRQPLTAPPVLNQTWALDFMTETLYDGRRVRLLTVIDEGNRESLEIAIGPSLPSRRVIRVARRARGAARTAVSGAGGQRATLEVKGQSFSDLTRASAPAHNAHRQAVPPSRNHTLTIVTQGQVNGACPDRASQSVVFQVEGPSIIYEVACASTAPGEGILPPGLVASGKRRYSVPVVTTA